MLSGGRSYKVGCSVYDRQDALFLGGSSPPYLAHSLKAVVEGALSSGAPYANSLAQTLSHAGRCANGFTNTGYKLVSYPPRVIRTSSKQGVLASGTSKQAEEDVSF